jgi:hypothetical protein
LNICIKKLHNLKNMYELVKFPNLCLSLFKKTNINQIATLPFAKYTQDFHYAYYSIQGLFSHQEESRPLAHHDPSPNSAAGLQGAFPGQRLSVPLSPGCPQL